MELIELVSPHVAVPVAVIILLAVLVFVFGFRTPVQPPKFDFEEKRSKRRSKQVKTKTSVSSHTASAAAESASEVLKSTPKSAKDVKPNSPNKAAQNESKSVPAKETKQDLKKEKKGKLKKEAQLVEVKPDNAKKTEVKASKKETEEDGQWTTIQVTKRGKKQKPMIKKDDGRAESPAMESEPEPENIPLPEAAAAAPAHVDEVEKSSPDLTSRAKQRKKKERAEAKDKPEEKGEQSVVEKPASASSFVPHNAEGKEKKKGKRETKSGGEAAASASEALPQDAAPAAGKAMKVEPNLEPFPASAPAPPSIGKAKPSQSSSTGQAKPGQPSSTGQVKPSPKKKKATSNENVQEVISKEPAAADLMQKPEEAVKKSEASKTDTMLSTVPKAQSIDPPVSQAGKQEPSFAEAGQPQASVVFDEIGDSWQEAAPKIKKKKSRRDN